MVSSVKSISGLTTVSPAEGNASENPAGDSFFLFNIFFNIQSGRR